MCVLSNAIHTPYIVYIVFYNHYIWCIDRVSRL
nr:MAG TPA: hypothetical protein [Caudoviricetes sp.]